MQDVPSELFKAWPTKWDEYVAPACWIKRTTLLLVPSTMTPFRLLFSVIALAQPLIYMLIPQMEDKEATGDLSSFRQRRNARISRSSPSVDASEGDLVLAREGDSSLFRLGMGPKLVHEKWTAPWAVTKRSCFFLSFFTFFLIYFSVLVFFVYFVSYCTCNKYHGYVPGVVFGCN